MLKIKTDQAQEYAIELKNGKLLFNDLQIETDIVKLSNNKFHMIWEHQSFSIEFLKTDETGKQLDMVINGKRKQVVMANEFDMLLAKLGMDKMAGSKANSIKAPMPGLVISIKVKEGDQVKKGDPILVLEAMKMENVIKAPADAIIGKINVMERSAVEKNQVLVGLV